MTEHEASWHNPQEVPEIYRGILMAATEVPEDAARSLNIFYPLLKGQGYEVSGKIFVQDLSIGQGSRSSIAIDSKNISVEEAIDFVTQHGLKVTGFALETPETRVEVDDAVSKHDGGTIVKIYRQDPPDTSIFPAA